MLFFENIPFLVLNIFTVLDPRMKLEYYRHHKWEQEWVDIAVKQVTDLYKAHYAPLDGSTREPEDVGKRTMYATIFPPRQVVEQDELSSYLTTPPIDPESDALEWWKVLP